MGDKTVSLVLSSGGARGMAHIGAIEALEERGYKIVSVSGSSAGALVGGIFASGQMDKFKDWICNLDRIDVFSLMDFTFPSRGFIKGVKVFNAMKNIVEDCQIESMKIPFVCNAVELSTGRERVFDKGSLYDAIRASVSIPTILTPAFLDGEEYIDGGILNPIPLNLIPTLHTGKLLIAVDCNGPRESYLEVERSEKKEGDAVMKKSIWVLDYREKLSSYFASEGKENKPKSMGSIDLLNHSFDLLQDKLSALVLEKFKLDVLIEISRLQARTLDFHKAPELIVIGKQKMNEALDKLEYGN